MGINKKLRRALVLLLSFVSPFYLPRVCFTTLSKDIPCERVAG
jgi:hypothetical protein